MLALITSLFLLCVLTNQLTRVFCVISASNETVKFLISLFSSENQTEELEEKSGTIDALSSRVEVLETTEEALKTTMNLADEYIVDREQQHKEELKELEEGLKR